MIAQNFKESSSNSRYTKQLKKEGRDIRDTEPNIGLESRNSFEQDKRSHKYISDISGEMQIVTGKKRDRNVLILTVMNYFISILKEFKKKLIGQGLPSISY